MVEFTGERVVPGQVNDDLWSEHFARYAFARGFAVSKHVLDCGCGTGYGSAELAQVATRVVGVDSSPQAIEFARTSYPGPIFITGSCESLPFRGAGFDVIVAFEVIEHLADYRQFVNEASRVLAPNGLFIVSTPNKRYYAESRAESGPNPYHAHEFEADEFYAELNSVFPHVALLLQNRVESFAFHPAKTFWPSDSRIDGGGGSVNDAHFFVAVCSRSPLPELRSFVYVPKAANILREREQHVQLLQVQVDRTNNWLQQTRQERDDLLDLYRKQKEELERHNLWAEQLNRQLDEAHQRVELLQHELTDEQAAATAVAQGYEAKVRELEQENLAKTEWARDTDARLTDELNAKSRELVECVKLLQQAETTVEERTLWAQRTEAQLIVASTSRWLKLGRRLGLGPVLQAQER